MTVGTYRRIKADPADWFDAAEVKKAKDYQRPLTVARIVSLVLSAAFIVDVLSLTARPGSPSHTLLASFAASGGEGTLRHRLPHAGSQVLAKTGTYAGASTLSGVVQDDRRRLGFAILINGVELERSRASQDRIVAALLRAL